MAATLPLRACECRQPIRNDHLAAVGAHPRCARCLRPMIGSALERAKYPHQLPKKAHGSSAHRVVRVQKFEAAQRRKAEKRKRAKRNRR